MMFRWICNSTRMLQLAVCHVVVCFCLFHTVATASPNSKNLLVVSDGSSSVYASLRTQIQSNTPDHDFTFISLDDNGYNPITPNTTAIITIGSKSAEWLKDQETTLPSMSILASVDHLNRLNEKPNTAYILVEQPVERIAKVVSDTLPDMNTGNLLISNRYKGDTPEVAEQKNFSLTTNIIAKSSNLTRIIRRLRGEIDVLIAYPDSDIYNAQTLKNILISTYKNNIPLIGYSKGFTRAGALLSVYTPPQYYAEEVIEWIQDGYPATQRPSRYFKVDINNNVAKSLNIEVDKSLWLSKDIWEVQDE